MGDWIWNFALGIYLSHLDHGWLRSAFDGQRQLGQ
jgi:hypothetical protein